MDWAICKISSFLLFGGSGVVVVDLITVAAFHANVRYSASKEHGENHTNVVLIDSTGDIELSLANLVATNGDLEHPTHHPSAEAYVTRGLMLLPCSLLRC